MAWRVKLPDGRVVTGEGNAPSERERTAIESAVAATRQRTFDLTGQGVEPGPARAQSSIPAEGYTPPERGWLPGGASIGFDPHVPTQDEVRGGVVAAGSTLGGTLGLPLGPPGVVAGSALGAAGASLASDVAGLDRSSTVGEGLKRAGWEGVYGAAGAALPPVVGDLGRRVFGRARNAVMALQPSVSALADRFGVRHGLEFISDTLAMPRRVIGQMPLTGRAFNVASQNMAADSEAAVGREAARVGAPRSLATGDQARAGRLAYRAGIANEAAARDRASAIYNEALPAAREADVRVPGDSARDAMSRIGGEVRSRRIPTTWEGRSEQVAAEYIPPAGPAGPSRSGAPNIGAGSGVAPYNPIAPTIPSAAAPADEPIDVAARAARVGTERTTATRDTATARFVRRWGGLGRAEDGTLSIDEHLAFVRELDDEIAKAKRAARPRAVRELTQIRNAAREDLRAASGPEEIVTRLREADAAFQAASELTENPVGQLFRRVDRRAFRTGYAENGPINEEQFAAELFAEGSPVLAGPAGVRQARALIGDRAFRVGFQNHLDDVMREAAQFERDAAGNLTGQVRIDDGALGRLGLFQPAGDARRQAMQEALRGTGQTVERLEELFTLLRRVSEYRPPDKSTFMARAAVFGGGGLGVAGAVVNPLATATAGGSGLTALVATRGLSRYLTNPNRVAGAIARLRAAERPNASDYVRSNAYAQAIKLLTTGAVDREEAPGIPSEPEQIEPPAPTRGMMPLQPTRR